MKFKEWFLVNIKRKEDDDLRKKIIGYLEILMITAKDENVNFLHTKRKNKC